MLPLIALYWELVGQHIQPRHHAGRLKQWLNMLRRSYPEAQTAFMALRTVNTPGEVMLWLQAELKATEIAA